MSLKIIYEDGESRPYAFCDHCDEPILNVKMGMYYWIKKDGQHAADGEPVEIAFYHKGTCDPQEQHPECRGDWWMPWEELSRLPKYMLNNWCGLNDNRNS